MATRFESAPTYAEPVLVDEVTGKARFNPLWLKWFLNVVQVFNSLLSQSESGTINHELLSGLLGGGASEHYHITLAQQASRTVMVVAGNPEDVAGAGHQN